MNLVKSIEEDKRVETRNPFVMLGVNLITKTRWNHIYSSQSDFDSELLQQPIPTLVCIKIYEYHYVQCLLVFLSIQRPYMTNSGCCIVSSKHMNISF